MTVTGLSTLLLTRLKLHPARRQVAAAIFQCFCIICPSASTQFLHFHGTHSRTIGLLSGAGHAPSAMALLVGSPLQTPQMLCNYPTRQCLYRIMYTSSSLVSDVNRQHFGVMYTGNRRLSCVLCFVPFCHLCNNACFSTSFFLPCCFNSRMKTYILHSC